MRKCLAPGIARRIAQFIFNAQQLVILGNAVAAGGGTDAATVQEFTIEHSWACVQSGLTSIGSTCNLSTTLNAAFPGASRGGKRSIWELDAVRIYDGGADGDGDTTADNTVFARPGIFIP